MVSLTEARELARRTATLAEELHRVYGGCAQMTLKALQEAIGVEDRGSFKAASALSGGVALAGEVCGALLGAVMAIGLALGREKLEPTSGSADYARAMEVAGRVFDEFRKELGAVRCRDLHLKLFGKVYDLRNPDEWREFVESGARLKCSRLCSIAARIAVEALASSGHLRGV